MKQTPSAEQTRTDPRCNQCDAAATSGFAVVWEGNVTNWTQVPPDRLQVIEVLRLYLALEKYMQKWFAKVNTMSEESGQNLKHFSFLLDLIENLQV